MSGERPIVVLLHGLGRTRRSMAPLQRRIERAGFRTWSRSYPSRHMPIVDLAGLVSEWLLDDLGRQPLVAVTHSLGGILFREMPGTLLFTRAVMLAPPNRGSRLAGRLLERPGVGLAMGPAARDIVDAGPWPTPSVPFAVVAGTRSASVGNPASWISRRLRVFDDTEANDGTVAVSETRLQGMADFAEVDASHTWMMRDRQVHRMVLAYLQTGRLRP